MRLMNVVNTYLYVLLYANIYVDPWCIWDSQYMYRWYMQYVKYQIVKIVIWSKAYKTYVVQSSEIISPEVGLYEQWVISLFVHYKVI